MEDVDVTWLRALEIWWAWLWRAFLWSILAGFVVGFVAGFVGAVEAAPFLGGAVGLPIGIWVLKGVLGKTFSDFRIALLSINDESRA